MKSLKNLNFGANEVLQRNQMKNVFGGDTLTHAPPGDGEAACNKKSCSKNSDCATGACAYFGVPCSAWGDCGCGNYCL